MYQPHSARAFDFIDHREILDTLSYADRYRNESSLLSELLQKAKEQKGLNHREASVLLATSLPEIQAQLHQLAKETKDRYYGKRIVLFAPLYLSNYCVNACVYCPYHRQNSSIARRKLSQEEIAREVIALQDMGHKRLALEAGEHPLYSPIEYILESIDTIYRLKHKNGAIRRVNVNIAATSIDNYKKLKEVGIGTYVLFQESYHKESYLKLHPSGPKHDYDYHTEAMDRAMQAGLDDLGLGVLFGLERYRYEFAALLMHAEHLEARYGVGPHTVSVPRIKAADGIDPKQFDNAIDDEIFKQLIALLRIAMPYTGLIVSTRESAEIRAKALELGVSQLSAASKTSVGGYALQELKQPNSEQFDISDRRSLDEIVYWLMDKGYMPSFCTACYRNERTGDRFMDLCKSSQMAKCCQANACMTLQEYLMDYASSETQKLGQRLLLRELSEIPNPQMRAYLQDKLQRIENKEERDFYI